MSVAFPPRRRPGKHPETAHEREDRSHHHARPRGENREVEVARAAAAPLVPQTRRLIPDKTLIDAASSNSGGRHLTACPCSESTRSGEIPVTPGAVTLIEHHQRRGQRRLFAGTGPHRGTICAQLGQVRVAIAKRPQHGNEEKRLAEDPPARETQRISDPLVMMLMRQNRVELSVREQLNRSLRDVDGGVQITGAECLWPRIRDHFHTGVSFKRLEGSDMTDKIPAPPALPPARAGGDGDRGCCERAIASSSAPVPLTAGYVKRRPASTT
jgi:hypothetical protein